MRILSTKILTPEQTERLESEGFIVEQYDALSIDLLHFDIPEEAANCIFSSQNAAKAFVANDNQIKQRSAFCVGEKAALLLEENGQKIEEIGQNAVDLGQKIIKNHQNKSFFYFSGNLRRPELPRLLAEQQVEFHEVPAYETGLHYPTYDQDFDAILYFSPSGVQSFHKQNKQTDYTAVCIGKTTASEALKHTKKTEISLHTTVDGVIDTAITLKKHD